MWCDFTWLKYTLYRHYTWPPDTTYDLLSTDTTLDLFSTDNALDLFSRHYTSPDVLSTDTTLDLQTLHLTYSLQTICLIYPLQTLRLTYLWSTLAVASSSTSMLFCRRIARARQTSCLCPTLRFCPLSDISMYRPSLSLWTFSLSCTCQVPQLLIMSFDWLYNV